MGGLFSKKSKLKSAPAQSRVTESDRAILQLKQQRDKLKQYQKKLVTSIERDRLVAKRLLGENKKDKALLLLKKKKFQENLISKTDNQLETLEQLVHDIEFAEIESQVLQGLKTGNESLKKMQQMMSIEEVEKIMDETAEAVEMERQISDLLSGGFSDEDEADIDAELEALLASQEEGEGAPALPDVPTAIPDVPTALPDVPTEDPSKTRREQTEKTEEPRKQALLA